MHQAEIAVGAFGMVLFHTEQRKPRHDAEHCAERTEHAAPEARDEPVEEEDPDQEDPDEPSLVEVELLALPTRNGGRRSSVRFREAQ